MNETASLTTTGRPLVFSIRFQTRSALCNRDSPRRHFPDHCEDYFSKCHGLLPYHKLIKHKLSSICPRRWERSETLASRPSAKRIGQAGSSDGFTRRRDSQEMKSKLSYRCYLKVRQLGQVRHERRANNLFESKGVTQTTRPSKSNFEVTIVAALHSF